MFARCGRRCTLVPRKMPACNIQMWGTDCMVYVSVVYSKKIYIKSWFRFYRWTGPEVEHIRKTLGSWETGLILNFLIDLRETFYVKTFLSLKKKCMLSHPTLKCFRIFLLAVHWWPVWMHLWYAGLVVFLFLFICEKKRMSVYRFKVATQLVSVRTVFSKNLWNIQMWLICNPNYRFYF